MNFSDPVIWDDLWEHTPASELVARLARHRVANPDWHARYVYALASSGRLDEATDQLDIAMDLYEGQPGARLDLLRGTRCILLAASGQFQEVQEYAQEFRSLTPGSVEAACLTQYALAYTHMYMGRHQQALMHVGQSIALATALDMPHRRRVAQMLWSHILQALGEQAPKNVLMEIAGSAHASTARHGAERIIESHLYAGEYQLASAFARSRGLPLERVARALMQDFSMDATGDEWCDKLAEGLQAACEMRYADIPAIEVNPWPSSTYGQLLNALRAMHAGATTNFSNVLGVLPNRADQRAYWHCLRLIACLNGHVDDNPSQLTLEAIESLLAVPNPHHVVRLLEAISPRTILLLSHAPDVRMRNLFNGVTAPLLVDTYISNHQRLSVPPEAARHLIHEAVGVEFKTNPGNMSKYRARLERYSLSPHRVVNIGHLFTYAERVRNASTGSLQEAWDGVLTRMRRVSPILDMAVASRLRD